MIETVIVIIMFTPLFLAVLFSYQQEPHFMDRALDSIRKAIHPPPLPPPPRPHLPFRPPPFSAPFNARAEYHAQQHEEWDAHFRALLEQSRHDEQA